MRKLGSKSKVGLLAALAVGSGSIFGTSLALWSSTASSAVSLQVARASFMLDSQSSTGGPLSTSIGPAEATLLRNQGYFTKTFRVESMTEGLRSLEWTATPQTPAAGSWFASSKINYTVVNSPTDCVIDGTHPMTDAATTGASSMPWDLTYKATATPKVQYLCVRGQLNSDAFKSEYKNVGSASGRGADGSVVANDGSGNGVGTPGDDTWGATVANTPDPTKEPALTITVAHSLDSISMCRRVTP